MGNENEPTQLELFETMNAAATKLGTPLPEEFVTFMKAGITAGKEVKALSEEWNKSHPQVINISMAAPDKNDKLSVIEGKLAKLEEKEKQELETQLNAVIAETKKVDPTFDDKAFLAPFNGNTSAAIASMNVFMKAVKHAKETVAEVETEMHVGDDAVDRVKTLTKQMFGEGTIDEIARRL